MNFNISTWPPRAHRFMLLLVWKRSSGELRIRNIKRLQEGMLALTKPPRGASLPAKRSFARKTYSEDHVPRLLRQTISAADDVWVRMRDSLARSVVVSLRTRTARTQNVQAFKSARAASSRTSECTNARGRPSRT